MATPDLKYGIETPQEWGGLGREISVRGWCFDLGGGELKGVRLKVGEAVFKAKRKQTRFGVAQMFPGVEAAVKSGFSAEVKLPRGKSELIFEARTADGAWHTIARKEARVRSWWSGWKKHAPEDQQTSYQQWVERYDQIDVASLEKHVFQKSPVLSIVLPVYDPPEALLRECLESVADQIYTHWELCIADDASPAPHVRAVIEEFAARFPDKVKVCFREKNGHICEASNSALELATGDFMVLLDHDDLLPQHALYWVAREIEVHPDVVLIYSDEDKIDEAGVRQDPYFKPDWDPDLLLGQNCISHLGVFRIEAVREAGSFRAGTQGSQDWDLVLRITEHCEAAQIRHIDRILYHWRLTAGSTAMGHSEKPYTVTAGLAAVTAALKRRHLKNCKVEVLSNNYLRLHYQLDEPPPRVEIIIPTRDRVDLLRRCIGSICELTEYPNYGITVVDNGTTDPATLEYLDTSDAKVIRDDGSFNYSRLNNRAVRETSEDTHVVVLLNNDTEVLDGGWLREMVSQASRSEIGAVGAKLLYPNGLVQHAGIFLGFQGAAGHLLHGKPDGFRDTGDSTRMVRTVSAVTAACLAVRKECYEEVGGLDEGAFAVAYNDVDFCLKLSEAGYRNLITPYAALIHDESVSRGGREQTEEQKARANGEIANLQSKWGALLSRDPYYNVNLTIESEDSGFGVPRRSRNES